jgi:peptidoglycan/LPS O-acetylase OafA/YrhL
MNMPKLTVVVGLLLVIQGLGFYFWGTTKSPTALIPSAIGLPMLILGVFAFRERLRKHMMHVAAALGTLGLLAALGRIATAGLHLSAAGVSLSLMVVLCGGFLGLCVKSFVDARLRQRATDA